MKAAGQQDASSELVTLFLAGRCDEFHFSQVIGLDCSLDLWHEDIIHNAVSTQHTSKICAWVDGALALYTFVLSVLFCLSRLCMPLEED